MKYIKMAIAMIALVASAREFDGTI